MTLNGRGRVYGHHSASDRMITRRRMLATAGSVALLAAGGRASAREGTGKMQITRSGTQPSQSGLAEYFTGSVRMTHASRVARPRASAAELSRSSRAPARHGTRIPWAKR